MGFNSAFKGLISRAAGSLLCGHASYYLIYTAQLINKPFRIYRVFQARNSFQQNSQNFNPVFSDCFTSSLLANKRNTIIYASRAFISSDACRFCYLLFHLVNSSFYFSCLLHIALVPQCFFPCMELRQYEHPHHPLPRPLSFQASLTLFDSCLASSPSFVM